MVWGGAAKSKKQLWGKFTEGGAHSVSWPLFIRVGTKQGLGACGGVSAYVSRPRLKNSGQWQVLVWLGYFVQVDGGWVGYLRLR